MRRVPAAVVAVVVFGVVASAGDAIDGAESGEDEVLGPGLVTVDVEVHHSRFGLGPLRVRPGTTVQFVVRNRDPINHEIVVGDDAVHARHERGSERVHPPVPGEVSLGPLERGVTFYEFDEPGRIRYACHLPGHVAYGMEGVIEVVEP